MRQSSEATEAIHAACVVYRRASRDNDRPSRRDRGAVAGLVSPEGPWPRPRAGYSSSPDVEFSLLSLAPSIFERRSERERAALGALAEDTNEARDLSPPEDIRDRQLVCDTRVLYSESVLWVALETSQLHISCGDFSSEH